MSENQNENQRKKLLKAMTDTWGAPVKPRIFHTAFRFLRNPKLDRVGRLVPLERKQPA